MSLERNNTFLHQSDNIEGPIHLTRQHQSNQCPNSKSDLIRQADHLDCLDCGALIVAKGVAITSQANHRPTALPLSPGALTIFSPRRLHLRCQGPEMSAQFNSLRDAVLLFTAGLDWVLEVRGILSRVRPEEATMPGRSDCVLLDVQVYSVGYLRSENLRGVGALAPNSPADLPELPTLAQIACEARS